MHEYENIIHLITEIKYQMPRSAFGIDFTKRLQLAEKKKLG